LKEGFCFKKSFVSDSKTNYNLLFFHIKKMACGGSIVVDHLSADHEITGSNPTSLFIQLNP